MSLIKDFAQKSKDEVSKLVKETVDVVSDGKLDAIEAYRAIKTIESLITGLTVKDPKKNKNAVYASTLMEEVLSAAEKEDGNSFKRLGAEFTQKEVGTKYDYSVCGDVDYANLLLEKTELDKKIKERETFLQSLPSKGMIVTNDETGETVTLYPPSKTSTTTLSVKIL